MTGSTIKHVYYQQYIRVTRAATIGLCLNTEQYRIWDFNLNPQTHTHTHACTHARTHTHTHTEIAFTSQIHTGTVVL